MGLDVRLPIGLMFILLGPILIVTGLVTATPVNWQSGTPMAVFGLLMLVLGLRGQGRNNRAEKKADAAAALDKKSH